MKEITEEQIKEAYHNWVPASFPTNKSAFTDGLKQGFALSQEQVQLEWIPIKEGEIMPVGKYMVKLQSPGSDLTAQRYVEIKKPDKQIPYFYATHYYRIIEPQ